MVRILMFGALQQVAGWRERSVGVKSLDALRDMLAVEDEELAARLREPGVFSIVNHVLVRGDRPLAPDDEVAFVPPVSGG